MIWFQIFFLSIFPLKFPSFEYFWKSRWSSARFLTCLEPSCRAPHCRSAVAVLGLWSQPCRQVHTLVHTHTHQRHYLGQPFPELSARCPSLRLSTEYSTARGKRSSCLTHPWACLPLGWQGKWLLRIQVILWIVEYCRMGCWCQNLPRWLVVSVLYLCIKMPPCEGWLLTGGMPSTFIFLIIF